MTDRVIHTVEHGISYDEWVLIKHRSSGPLRTRSRGGNNPQPGPSPRPSPNCRSGPRPAPRAVHSVDVKTAQAVLGHSDARLTL